MAGEIGKQVSQLPAEVRTVTRFDGHEVHSRMVLRHSIYVAAPEYSAEFTDGVRRLTGTIGHADVDDADEIERATALALLGAADG